MYDLEGMTHEEIIKFLESEGVIRPKPSIPNPL